MDSFGNWLAGLGDRVAAWFVRRFTLMKDPESMIGLFIVTLWGVFAGAVGGWLAILILSAVICTLHIFAVETGSHVVLWLTTAALLVLIVISSAVTFNGLSPIMLAAAGTTALIHNELVRINYTRRRNAVVDEEVFHASGIGLAIAGAIGVVGTALISLAESGGQRSWLWMPAAVGVLILIGFALAIWPTRTKPKSLTKRWQPGARIPPQPIAGENSERF